MDEALVEHAQDHVDHEYGQHEQNEKTLLRGEEGLGRAREAARYRRRQHVLRFALHIAERGAQRDTRREIKGDRDRRKLAGMVHRHWADARCEPRYRVEWNDLPLRRPHPELAERLDVLLKLG